MNEEYVYIFTNPAMPDYVKIGITDNIERRLKELSKPTAVAEPFECYACLTVKGDKPCAREVEKALHFFLADKRTKKREFFTITPSEAEKYFKYVESINPRLKYSLYKGPGKKRAKPTTFKMLNIPIGAELVFKSDDSIRCQVYDDKNSVTFNDEITTLSALAVKKNNGNPINGFTMFIYPESDLPNETLWERRCRLSLLS